MLFFLVIIANKETNLTRKYSLSSSLDLAILRILLQAKRGYMSPTKILGLFRRVYHNYPVNLGLIANTLIHKQKKKLWYDFIKTIIVLGLFHKEFFDSLHTGYNCLNSKKGTLSCLLLRRFA